MKTKINYLVNLKTKNKNYVPILKNGEKDRTAESEMKIQKMEKERKDFADFINMENVRKVIYVILFIKNKNKKII